jgi:hypothetical protein
MNDPRNELMNDLLLETAPAQFRIATLERGLALCRARRRRKAVGRRIVALAAPGLLVVWLLQFHSDRFRTTGDTGRAPAAIVEVEAPDHARYIPGTSIRVISDEELIEFFKDRPVVLVGPPGHQRLVPLDSRQP